LVDETSYLARIGFTGQADASVETIDALIGLHQQNVPFENIDIVRLHRPIVLDRERLVEKIVDERRGGFCYELNGAFSWLLEQLGAQVTYGFGQWQLPDGSRTEPFDHIVLAAVLPGEGERLLVDVGFGADSPVTAIPLRDGGEKPVAHHAICGYRARQLGDEPNFWRIEQLKPEHEWTVVYDVDLTPRALSEFNDRCELLQTSPDSHFTQRLICSRATTDGRVTIGGGTFIQTVDGDRSEREVAGLDDELALLDEWFSIRIDPDQYGEMQ
jgi:N-hydroxyarylamine O-acetyltransferase